MLILQYIVFPRQAAYKSLAFKTGLPEVNFPTLKQAKIEPTLKPSVEKWSNKFLAKTIAKILLL